MAHLYWNHQKCLVKMQPRTAESVSETGFRHHISDKLLQQFWYRKKNGNQSSHHHTPFLILSIPTLGSGFGAPPSSSRLSSSILSTGTLYLTSRSLFFLILNKLYLCLALLLPLATMLSLLITVKINIDSPSPLRSQCFSGWCTVLKRGCVQKGAISKWTWKGCLVSATHLGDLKPFGIINGSKKIYGIEDHLLLFIPELHFCTTFILSLRTLFYLKFFMISQLWSP